MKVDGCGDNSYYPHGYQAMGKALENSGGDIECKFNVLLSPTLLPPLFSLVLLLNPSKSPYPYTPHRHPPLTSTKDSCSWPAYIGDNETVKPFATFIMDGLVVI